MKSRYSAMYGILLATLVCLSFQAFSADADGAGGFSQAEIDQMLAPVALYPDALLSQILMASTYPADVAEAVDWSKANPDLEGDAAVEAVQDKPWDPSVASLVAFPQVLDMMRDKPQWVQQLGDAFLADPDAVMDTVQTLRHKAKEQGNLETTEQQTVSVVPASDVATTEQQTVVTEGSTQQTIIVIEPSNPEIVYVPAYDPVIIYGAWWWPHYRPFYYRPLPRYGFGAGLWTGIGFGVGLAITNSLWGGVNWRNNRVDINVNRYNNINVNRRIDSNRRTTDWKHNNKNRRGVPYRDAQTRNKYDNRVGGADGRKDYRGRDADRDRARDALKDRGVDPRNERAELRGSSGDRVRQEARDVDRKRADTGSAGRDRKQSAPSSGKFDRDAADRNRKTGTAQRPQDRASDRTSGRSDRTQTSDRGRSRQSSNAFDGVGNAKQTQRNSNRGRSSQRSMGGGNRSGGNRGGGMRSGGGRR